VFNIIIQAEVYDVIYIDCHIDGGFTRNRGTNKEAWFVRQRQSPISGD
jgi:hypothetical protein